MNVWAFRRLVRENRRFIGCQCPLGLAMGTDAGSMPSCTRASEQLGLTEDYCYGVAMGFDGDTRGGVPDLAGARFGKRMRIVAGITEDGGEL